MGAHRSQECRAPRGPLCLLACALAAAMVGAPACGQESGRADPAPVQSTRASIEPVQSVNLLDNGDGSPAQTNRPAGAADELSARLPWWEGELGVVQSEGVHWISTPSGRPARQPIAAFTPYLAELRIRGTVAGSGLLTLEFGQGGSAVVELREPAGSQAPRAFELRGPELLKGLSGDIRPRLTLELATLEGAGRPASWTDLSALVQLPCPREADLRAEIVAHLERIFATWMERGRDRIGPRPTSFLCGRFDAVSGQPLGAAPSLLHPIYERMLEAWEFEPNPAWKRWLEEYLEDFLALGFHPSFGLPREWDGELDLPQDQKPIEIARYLDFLIDVSEHGPDSFRERALGAATRMAETVLEKGLLPDGSIAAKYIPADATPRLDVAPLRLLDVAAQIARLGALRHDDRYLHAAHNAMAQLEYTHYWGGTWNAIDPDFDDSFGNWGGRCAVMLASRPDDPIFRRFLGKGFEHFAPLWEDALRFGGSLAADQVRCWDLLADYARVEPAVLERLRPLLAAALRAHFKGEQYDNGAWGDVTIYDFAPKSVEVGDFPGFPSNLLWGLALAYARDLGLRSDDVRAMYTAVLRSSEQAYRAEYGWLLTRSPSSGQNPAGGEIRVLLGLVEMLGNLGAR
jgi:hypothetical protein